MTGQHQIDLVPGEFSNGVTAVAQQVLLVDRLPAIERVMDDGDPQRGIGPPGTAALQACGSKRSLHVAPAARRVETGHGRGAKVEYRLRGPAESFREAAERRQQSPWQRKKRQIVVSGNDDRGGGKRFEEFARRAKLRRARPLRDVAGNDHRIGRGPSDGFEERGVHRRVHGAEVRIGKMQQAEVAMATRGATFGGSAIGSVSGIASI